MFTRTISAFVAIAIFIAIVYFLPIECFFIAVSLICAIMAYELTWRSGIVKVRALSISASLFAAATPFFLLFDFFEEYTLFLVFLCVAVSFCIWLFNYGKASLVMVLVSVIGGTIIPAMFSMIIKIRMAAGGEFLILLPFLAAWMTDTGAYFTGVCIGKHKLCERISPKKTVEGAIGGIVFCIASLIVFAFVTKLDVNLFLFGVGALVLSVLSQIGDLSFSIIKREYNIKDYGNIMPGHGGVLDRFDSTIFTIPAVYFLLMIFGIIV